MNRVIPEHLRESIRNQRISTIYKRLFVLVVIAILGFFLYQRLSFTEKVARDTANRFFNLMTNKNPDYKSIKEIYPILNFSRVVFKTPCTINNISKNSDGDYEVYATYSPNEVYSYPISLVISKGNNEVTIKSSRGISYSYYDKTLEYGKKKGCLTGDENDFQLEEIIREKRLRNELEMRTNSRLEDFYRNIESRANIHGGYGVITLDIIIRNNNNFNFVYGDLDCKVNYYDSADNLTSSDDVTLYDGVAANSFATRTLMKVINNAVRCRVIKKINITDELKNRVKDLIISEETYSCN
jgi:hypothetical protein